MATTKIDLSRQSTNSGAVSLNSQNITNLATPVNPNDASNKAYVDATAQGLSIKASCRVASTGSNITLSGTQTIDGITLNVGDRILVKDQTTASANGIYVVASGAWSRATDSATLVSGQFTFVAEGTINGGSGWVITTDNPITTGTTNITYTQFSGAGEISVGSGLTKTGNNISIQSGGLPISQGGTGATTASGATTNLLPSQTGNANKVLSTDGAGNLSWVSAGTAAYVRRTSVTGSQNSSNKVFTLGNALSSGSDSVYLNGQLLNPSASLNGGNDYYLSGTTLTFDTTFTAPSSTDIITVNGVY